MKFVIITFYISRTYNKWHKILIPGRIKTLNYQFLKLSISKADESLYIINVTFFSDIKNVTFSESLLKILLSYYCQIYTKFFLILSLFFAKYTQKHFLLQAQAAQVLPFPVEFLQGITVALKLAIAIDKWRIAVKWGGSRIWAAIYTHNNQLENHQKKLYKS